MATPRNLVYVQGITTIDDDGLNSFLQNCLTASTLRNFVGIGGMAVLLDGISAVNDGFGGYFIWQPGVGFIDDDMDTIVPYQATAGAWVRLDLEGAGGGGGTVTWTSDLPFRFDGGGNVPALGVLGDGIVDFACTITGWTVQSTSGSGQIELDIWKTPYAANTPPTNANSITGSAPPGFESGNESARSSTLTDWTTAIGAGDWLRFSLTEIASITAFTLTLSISRTAPVS